jgi:phosphatidylglycerophosphate synthase
VNLPNGLTVARIIVTPLIAALPFVESSRMRFAAFILFLAAAISDWFDGHLARTRKQETDLGRMLDPLADKLLLVGTFVPMYFIAAIWPAKWKTGIQLVWSGAAYFWFWLATLMLEHGWTGPVSRTIGMILGSIGALAMLVAIALTLYSLFIYMRDYGYLLRTKALPHKPLSS